MKLQKFLHGKKASKKLKKLQKILFEGKGLNQNLPEIKIKLNDIQKGINILDFLLKNKIVIFKSEARRAIAE